MQRKRDPPASVLKRVKTIDLPLSLPSAIKIVYCSDTESIEQQCEVIEMYLSFAESCMVFCGFDCEWKVTYTKGSQPKVALIQLYMFNTVFLFHIAECGLLPCIDRVLSCSALVKVGVNVKGDIQKLQRDYGGLMDCHGCDVRDVALACQQALPSHTWPVGSLEHMVYHYIGGASLPKPSALRCGDWERIPLSPQQKTYAALDAYASWAVMERLRHRFVDAYAADAPRGSDPFLYLVSRLLSLTASGHRPHPTPTPTTADAHDARALSPPAPTGDTHPTTDHTERQATLREALPRAAPRTIPSEHHPTAEEMPLLSCAVVKVIEGESNAN